VTHFDSINLHSVSIIAALWLLIFVLYMLNGMLLLRKNRVKLNKLHDRVRSMEHWCTEIYAYWMKDEGSE
jgi:hypothetical protein